MPNWVFSQLIVTGDKLDLQKLQEQLNQPVTKHYPDSVFDKEQSKWVHTPATQHYSNPVFSFWNVIAPTDLEAYFGEDKREKSNAFSEDGKIDSNVFMDEFNGNLATNNNWYWWNLRHWGTKWDIAVRDGDEWASTRLEIGEDGEELTYSFETAWSPALEVIGLLAQQHPTLIFNFHYEEEQGWGGEVEWQNGEVYSEREWDIPASHEDYENLGQECNCETNDDPTWWFADCPMSETHDRVDDQWVEKTLSK